MRPLSKTYRYFTWLLIGMGFGLGRLSADTVEMFSGEIIHGKIISEPKKPTLKIIPDGENDKSPNVKTVYAFRVKRIIKGNSYRDYLTRKEKCQTADDYYNLGDFCKSNKFLDEAEQMWNEAIKIDPNHEKARNALGHKKEKDGTWLTPEQIKEATGYVKVKDRWVKKEDQEKAQEEELKKEYSCAYPLNLQIAVKPAADDAWFKTFSEQVRFYSEVVWIVTDGLIYLNNVEITDLSDKGQYVVMNLDQQTVKTPGGESALGVTINHGRIEIPGRCDPYTFIHEWGHSKGFDHHDNCVMKQGGGPRRFCDECLAKLIILFGPNVKYRPDHPEKPPEVKIKCTHNKPK